MLNHQRSSFPQQGSNMSNQAPKSSQPWSMKQAMPQPCLGVIHDERPAAALVTGLEFLDFENRKNGERKLEEQETGFWSNSGQSPTPRRGTQRLGVQ
ncbi:hypothetical protein PIB30_094889, partial [Stylosanthes scabra]|nr:hypothetical protein [Stylosanthes scabra]